MYYLKGYFYYYYDETKGKLSNPIYAIGGNLKKICAIKINHI